VLAVGWSLSALGLVSTTNRVTLHYVPFRIPSLQKESNYEFIHSVNEKLDSIVRKVGI